MEPCENIAECLFGKMSNEQIKAFVEEAANRGATRALESIGLTDPESKDNIKELISLFSNYKLAKRATASAIWEFSKDAAKALVKLGSKALGVFTLMYLLIKFGVDPMRVNELTKVIK